MCTEVRDVELRDGIASVPALAGRDALRVLVRRDGRPVGWVQVDDVADGVSAERLRAAIADQLGASLAPLLLAPATRDAVPVRLPPITVVVCTRDRADRLAGCLDALLALDYPEFEVLVVDNASRSADTARLAAARGVRCVREERPGLDWARNRGLVEARHGIIAFTDDDVRVDPRWLRAIGAAFGEPEVMVVTGLIAPAELETRAQLLFELEYGGMVQALARRRVRRAEITDRDLLWSSAFGAGANMAFRRTLFDTVGAFDVGLDVGTPSGGGGDIEMLHRAIAGGHTLLYEPAALVWHQHRRDEQALRRQLFDNGRGFCAYLLTCARNRTLPRSVVLHFALRKWLGWWVLRRVVRPGALPRALVLAELAGAILGPWYYLRARAHARRVARQSMVEHSPGAVAHA